VELIKPAIKSTTTRGHVAGALRVDRDRVESAKRSGQRLGIADHD